MSLSVPIVSATLLGRFNAPPTFFSDSDSPETPETTYSFQELKQYRTMQSEQNYLEPILSRPPHFNTDDEMVDSDIERKDNDIDIDIDAYSNTGGVDLDDVNIAMEDGYVDTAPETYDNDDLMIDEEEVILFQEQQQQQQQQQQSPVLPTNSLTSHNSSDLPDPSQDTIRPQSAQTSTTDAPLFSFNHHNSTPARSSSFAVQEQPSVPDHSLYEDVPSESVEITEAAASVEVQSSKTDAGSSAGTHKDDGPQRPQSPVKVIEKAHAGSDNLLEDVVANDSTELDNDLHHHGNWSENTSTTLAHEPTLLEDQQAFEDENNHNNHAAEVGAEVESRTPVSGYTTAGFTQYNIHPIVVQFGENRLSLFPPPPPIAEDGSIGSPINDLEFLVQDHEVCEKGIDQLFQELRSVLDGVVSKDMEFVMELEGYGVTIGEDNKTCNTFSLQDILSFHVQLHQHDGVETPEPLQINLTTRPSLVNRIASLTAAVNQGIGFSQAVGIAGSPVEDSYMKVEDGQSEGDAQEQDTQPDQEQIEYHNSDDEHLEGRAAVKSEASQRAYPTLATPLTQEDNGGKQVEPNKIKAENPVVKKVEEIDDDDDFDLEYGNEGNGETEKDKSEADGVELKVDSTKPPSESSSASETPKPAARPIDENSKATIASVQVESTTEVVVEEISDEPSEGVQQPEEIQDTPSDHIASEQEDEELIEYEDDNETIQHTTGDIEEHQPVESKNSPRYLPSDQGSPQGFSEESQYDPYSPPDQAIPQESPNYSPLDQEIPIAPESTHVDVEDQKAESPVHSSSKESDHKIDRAESWAETDENSTHKNGSVSSDSKIPSSIPVFQGDDGIEGEYEYTGNQQQQQEYQGYGYDNQGLQFEFQEGEYDEEHGGAGDENDHNNLQGTEYNQEDFEYAADYPIDEQSGYLDEEGSVLQDDTVEHEAYVGDDGAYDDFEGEQEYPAEDENGYPIEYPHEGPITYQRGRFNDTETVTDNEFGIPIKGDHGHSLSPSCAVDTFDKSSVKEAEEEQLIDYEDDEAELVQELEEQPPSQPQKSPGDQKRMREDEPEQSGYESTGENQVAKRVRSQ